MNDQDKTEGTGKSGSHEAWSTLADQFTAIARQFRQHYERVSTANEPETEAEHGSLQQAVKTVGKTIEDTARAIEDSAHDPKFRQDTGEAGTALLRAVGATLTDLGASLQREADGHRKH